MQTRDGMREISHGRWEQMTRREVEAQFPDEAAAWEEDPYTFAPQGGESGLIDSDMSQADESEVVPRLNYEQALEIAILIAGKLASLRE